MPTPQVHAKLATGTVAVTMRAHVISGYTTGLYGRNIEMADANRVNGLEGCAVTASPLCMRRLSGVTSTVRVAGAMKRPQRRPPPPRVSSHRGPT
jgi:hypothetical protein